MYPWHRVPEDGEFQGPKTAPMSFQWIWRRLNSWLACLASQNISLLWPYCGWMNGRLIATMTVHEQWYCSNWDSLAATCKLIHSLETQRMISLFKISHMAHTEVWWKKLGGTIVFWMKMSHCCWVLLYLICWSPMPAGVKDRSSMLQQILSMLFSQFLWQQKHLTGCQYT